jgi:hypothetical protein
MNINPLPIEKPVSESVIPQSPKVSSQINEIVSQEQIFERRHSDLTAYTCHYSDDDNPLSPG